MAGWRPPHKAESRDTVALTLIAAQGWGSKTVPPVWCYYSRLSWGGCEILVWRAGRLRLHTAVSLCLGSEYLLQV